MLNNVPCGNSGRGPATIQKQGSPGFQPQAQPTQAQIAHVAALIAKMDYADYAQQFLYPSDSLMVKSGLWLELEAVIGFVVGLGLGSLIGQRTVAVILMIILEVILTPILSMAHLPHLLNLQRAVVGLATAHLAPGGLPVFGGGGGGPGGGSGNPALVPESDHRGRLRHRGVAGGLVDPRRVADDEEGRLTGGGKPQVRIEETSGCRWRSSGSVRLREVVPDRHLQTRGGMCADHWDSPSLRPRFQFLGTWSVDDAPAMTAPRSSTSSGTDESIELRWDPYDESLKSDPYPVWKRLRDEAPVYYNEHLDFFALSRFADVERAHRDPKLFSSARGTVLELMAPERSQQGMMIFLDPPEHTRLRRLVSRAFTPRRMSELETEIRALCITLLDAQQGKTHFDFVADFAARLPASVIAALLGVPSSDREEVREHIDLLFHLDPVNGMVNDVSATAVGWLIEYMDGQFARTLGFTCR